MSLVKNAIKYIDFVDGYIIPKLDLEKFNTLQIIRTDLTIRALTAKYTLQYMAAEDWKQEQFGFISGAARLSAWKKMFPTLSAHLAAERESEN